jgi:hypothetical protein
MRGRGQQKWNTITAVWTSTVGMPLAAMSPAASRLSPTTLPSASTEHSMGDVSTKSSREPRVCSCVVMRVSWSEKASAREDIREGGGRERKGDKTLRRQGFDLLCPLSECLGYPIF